MQVFHLTRVTTDFDMDNWTIASTATNYRLDVSAVSNFVSYAAGYNNLYISTNSHNVTGLSANTTYYYRVRAQNSGDTSANSGTITVLTAPPVPTATSATNITHDSSSATWNSVSGANMYAVDVSTTSDFTTYNTWTSTGTAVSVIGLTENTTYYYRVRARNAAGSWSGNSSYISFTTLPTPPNATAATNVTSTSFTANWGSVNGATQYLLDIASDINFSSYSTAVFGVTTANITNLTSGKTYYYRVRDRIIKLTGSVLYSRKCRLIIGSAMEIRRVVSLK